MYRRPRRRTALNTPSATLTLRVEGTATTFEGRVTTTAHTVKLPSAANPEECPLSEYSAVDDAGRSQRLFTWDGRYHNISFISRIGLDAETEETGPWWTFIVNYQRWHNMGTNPYQEVVWHLDNDVDPLKAYGPQSVKNGEVAKYRVTRGLMSKEPNPVEGAIIGGVKTDANGYASLTFKTVGKYVLKAEYNDPKGLLRSNQVVTQVW